MIPAEMNAPHRVGLGGITMLLCRKYWIAAILSVAISSCAIQAHAQANAAPAVAKPSADFQPPSDDEIAMLRKDIRSKKKQLIAANMKFTDTEAQKFWPVYDAYTADLVKINDTKYEL